MRRSVLVLVALAGLGGSIAGCGGDKTDTYDVVLQPTAIARSAVAPLIIELSANGSTVVPTVGQRLLVRLPRDPASTGEWGLVNAERGILITDGGPTSEGNATVWPFRAIQRGVTTLAFTYGPANEPSIGPEPTFMVDVRVI
ncbi:protease inhibitor I42 family protein [Nocardia alba]|uniref:Putative secreted protein n=1 Tax=Nocardia alba TaxID=225051 RepID=A0A4R1G2S5_9NOCA|nr:protease inhibitor I42 family protein [Nocardia alba]TCJ99378.1 putative secreted protein [Nocardia alba]